MRRKLLPLLSLIAVLGAAPVAEARRPTCRQIRADRYEMFSKAGDRAVGAVVASVSPPCRGGRKLKPAVMKAKVRAGLTRVGRRYDEVGDSAVVEAVADALEAAGAGYVEALDEIYPG